MATNNAVSFNQLKKSVFTLKNYVDNIQPNVLEEIVFDASLEKIQEGMKYATDNPSKASWATCLFDIDVVHEIQPGQIVYFEYGGNEFLSQLASDKILYFYAFDAVETDYNNTWTMPDGQIMCAMQFGVDINKQPAENKCLVRLWASNTNVTGAKLKIKHKKAIDENTFNDDIKFWNSISMNRQKNSQIGGFSVALGEHAEASSTWAIAMGNDVHARGSASISLGQQNISQGERSVTIGYSNRALGNYSYSHGRANLASATYASATGYKTKATGMYATTSGVSTTASGSSSIAEGNTTTASGDCSHAEGHGTIAQGQNQHVQGRYNIEDTANKYAHIVGNGTSSSAKSNAHTLDWNGNGWYAGKLSQDGTPTGDKDLTTKKYVDGKVAGIVNSAPETLDTLQELATALGNDPNFATTVATQIGKKVDKVDGMSLTHNDLTNELKANYDAAYAYSQAKHSYNDLTDKPTIPSIDGLATESYVDSKTSMENVIYEGNGTGPDVISDYWTGCPVSSGNGCWVINKQITFDSSKPNPYYLLCDNTLYSPENSTFDATNSAWIYPKVYNTGTIFICNKYNGENKLVLPWDNANSPSKMKLYTKTELATAISDGDLEATSDEVKAMLANVLGGDYSGKKN